MHSKLRERAARRHITCMQQQVTCKKFNAQCVFLSQLQLLAITPREINASRATTIAKHIVAQRINIYLAAATKADLPGC
jgi:hypothetical protein